MEFFGVIDEFWEFFKRSQVVDILRPSYLLGCSTNFGMAGEF